MEQHWTVRVPSGYLLGPWRVVEGLASGSWSSVYAAEQTGEPTGSTPRRAALKFIPTGTLTARQLGHLADMTGRELAVHRSVTHPRLIQVYDTMVVDDPDQPELDGATVLVLELATGSAAAALSRTAGGGLPDAPGIVAGVCAGLAHLHRAGWVHGDVKPGNVLLMADGSVRLADFGLAAELDGTHAYLPPGGTTDYVPPERWAETIQPHGAAVRQTADVWALGVTACQLLTGQLPFPGVTARARASAAAAYAAGRAELSLPAGLTGCWRQFVADCLARDHATRQQYHAAALRDRAEAILAADATVDGTHPTDAWLPAEPAKAGLPAEPAEAQLSAEAVAGGRVAAGPPAGGAVAGGRRRWRWVAAAVALGVLVAGGGAAAFWRWGPPGDADGQGSGRGSRSPDARYAKYFRTDADIPRQYYDLIVQAGTGCTQTGVVTPVLVAALLKAESNFDPNLADPGKDEYGIARWTPSVLRYYLPAGQRETIPAPPFPPEMSIPAVGVFLCRFAALLEVVPGDPELNLVAAYRTSSTTVQQAGGVPDRPALREYMPRLQAALARYRPAGGG